MYSAYICGFAAIFNYFLILKVVSFNVAPKADKVFEHPSKTGLNGRNSYFGYSVGIVKSKQGYFAIIGAPRSNSSSNTNINEPGTLFRCPLRGNQCQEVIIDETDNDHVIDAYQNLVNIRDHSWNGAALDVNSDDEAVVCGPRWKSKVKYDAKSLRMNGYCAILNSDLQSNSSKLIYPLKNSNRQIYAKKYYYYNYGQSGMVVYFPPAFLSEPEYLVLGAPGIFNWHGSSIRMTPNRRGFSSSEKSGRYIPLNYKTPFILNPLDTYEIKDFVLFSYSIVMGVFWTHEKGKQRLYVAGAPRGDSINGQVFVYDKTSESESLIIFYIRKGEQFGEYFGASVATPDLNGDGFSDVVVGAPLYSDRGFADMGCIYVFYSNRREPQRLETKGLKLEGSRVRNARFGSTLCHPGDINDDGFEDLLVGAPYEEDPSGGYGAVYVFMGYRDGIRSKYTQRLLPSVVAPGRNLQGFGISFSRIRDVDGNGFPDFAVGSFTSENAVLMLSRPVISLKKKLNTNPKTLSLRDEQFIVFACVSYTGRFNKDLDVLLRLYLRQESNDGETNVYFEESGGVNQVITAKPAKKETCYRQVVKIKVRTNSGSPIIIQMETELQSKQLTADDPVLDEFETDKSPIHVVSFITGCEKIGDSTCISDLNVTVSPMDFRLEEGILVGEKKKVGLQIKVSNSMEPAFLPYINVTVPYPVDFLPWRADCERIKQMNDVILLCQLSNPLTDPENIIVELDVSQLQDRSPNIKVSITAKSVADIEHDPHNNEIDVTIKTKTQASIYASGWSSPEQIIYSKLNKDDIDTNSSIEFSHTAVIRKSGITPLDTVRVKIQVPRTFIARNGQKQHLLEIVTAKNILENRIETCSLSKTNEDIKFIQSYTDSDYNSTIYEKKDEPLSILECGSKEIVCQEIICHIGPWLKKQQTARITLFYRINMTTFNKIISMGERITLITYFEAIISSVNQTESFTGQRKTTSLIQTFLSPRSISEEVQWWIYALSILGGLFLILLISYGLFEVGFFKRKTREKLETHKANLVQNTHEPAY